MSSQSLVSINGPISKDDKVALLATTIGPILRMDHPLPWRVKSEGEQFQILDKKDRVVITFKLQIQAERFIAFIDRDSPERRHELEAVTEEAHFQADWVERNGGLAALLHGVPRLRRTTLGPP